VELRPAQSRTVFATIKRSLLHSEKQAKVKDLEYQIDGLVYKLYDLEPDEIEIVENKTR